MFKIIIILASLGADGEVVTNKYIHGEYGSAKQCVKAEHNLKVRIGEIHTNAKLEHKLQNFTSYCMGEL